MNIFEPRSKFRQAISLPFFIIGYFFMLIAYLISDEITEEDNIFEAITDWFEGY